MIDVTPFADLGKFRNEWLDATHHFSFGSYDNPARRGFGHLLVWNDDRIRGGTGFGMHGHRDMEIVTYVRTGAITHRDNLGNRGVTAAGDVQVMSAGTGIMHAELNSETEDTTLFQIWVLPRQAGLPPRWDAAKFPKDDRAGRLVPLASGEPGVEALAINQDATLYGATLKAGSSVEHALRPGRRAYLVSAKGDIRVNGVAAKPRDGVAAAGEPSLRIEAGAEDVEVLLLDLP